MYFWPTSSHLAGALSAEITVVPTELPTVGPFDHPIPGFSRNPLVVRRVASLEGNAAHEAKKLI